ncbi:hypothetical protein SDJN03_06444, partial [Cucurbita argyrosperma subsp. sororia]
MSSLLSCFSKLNVSDHGVVVFHSHHSFSILVTNNSLNTYLVLKHITSKFTCESLILFFFFFFFFFHECSGKLLVFAIVFLSELRKLFHRKTRYICVRRVKLKN